MSNVSPEQYEAWKQQQQPPPNRFEQQPTDAHLSYLGNPTNMNDVGTQERMRTMGQNPNQQLTSPRQYSGDQLLFSMLKQFMSQRNQAPSAVPQPYNYPVQPF